MNGMKGLLLKDFYFMQRHMRVYLLLMLVFVLLPGSMPLMAVIYSVMLPITVLAYDDNAKWPELAAMLPFSTRALVFSKYLLGYLLSGCFVLLAVLARAAYQVCWPLVTSRPVDNDFAFSGDFVNFMLLIWLGSLTLLALNLPLMFRLGAEKGRLAFILTLGVLFGITIPLSSLPIPTNALLPGALLLTVALNAASYCISVKLYNKRLRTA